MKRISRLIHKRKEKEKDMITLGVFPERPK